MPAAPPSAARTPASASHWRVSARSEAPIASWMACSRRACDARVSISPETLTQAMSRSTTTAPSSAHKACRAGPITCSTNGVTTTWLPTCGAGRPWSSRRPIADRSVAAVAALTPSRSLATKTRTPTLASTSVFQTADAAASPGASGAQYSAPRG